MVEVPERQQFALHRGGRLRRQVVLALAVLLALAATAGEAAQAEDVRIPTAATISKGKLIDEYPGPPPPGTTDLAMPFFGQISTEHPACRTRRTYELGRVESSGEFVWMGKTTAPKSGEWIFGLAGEPLEPLAVAVRVLPRRTVYEGASYICEEAISSTVPFDSRDFTPCLIAQAEQRGYGPAIRETKKIIREAEARNDEVTARVYNRQLKKFKSYRDDIKRAVRNRC